jgi:hypothetical protein
MHISRTADYGVRIMTRLAAAREGTRMTVADLLLLRPSLPRAQSFLWPTGRRARRLVHIEHAVVQH